MTKEPNSKVTVDSSAKTEEAIAKIFSNSGYPITLGDNIKLIFNFLFNFLP